MEKQRNAIRRFNKGDKVVLKDFEFLRKNRSVTQDDAAFKRFYDYMKSKEPLTINYYREPGELRYSDDYTKEDLRGKPTQDYYYNIPTPRSKSYIFQDCELEPYIEGTTSDS